MIAIFSYEPTTANDVLITCDGASDESFDSFYCFLADVSVNFNDELVLRDGDPSRVTVAKCYFCKLDYLPGSFFMIFPNIEQVSFTESGIKRIGRNAFSRGVELKELYLDLNELTEIEQYTFSSLENLEKLYLNENSIVHLHSYAFLGLRNLKVLFLKGNSLAFIDKTVFASLDSLSVLDLSSNKFTTLGPYLFQHLPSLTELSLDFCNIESISNTTFIANEKLTTLNLYDNVCVDQNFEEGNFRDNNFEALQKCFNSTEEHSLISEEDLAKLLFFKNCFFKFLIFVLLASLISTLLTAVFGYFRQKKVPDFKYHDSIESLAEIPNYACCRNEKSFPKNSLSIVSETYDDFVKPCRR